MSDLGDVLPLVIGLGVAHLGLAVYALRDLFSLASIHVIGKIVWSLIIIYVVVTGPLMYLMYGRGGRGWARRIEEMQRRAKDQQSADQ